MLDSFETIEIKETLEIPRNNIGVRIPQDLLKEYILSSTQIVNAEQAFKLGVVPPEVSSREMEAYFRTSFDALVEGRAVQILFWNRIFNDYNIKEDLKHSVNIDSSTGELYLLGDA